MRHAGQIFPEMVANSYHADHVRLIGEDLSRDQPRGPVRRLLGARRRRPRRSTRVRSRRRWTSASPPSCCPRRRSPRSDGATSEGSLLTSPTPRPCTSRSATRSGSPSSASRVPMPGTSSRCGWRTRVARRRPRPAPRARCDALMNVTVVICAYTLERWDAARASPSPRASTRRSLPDEIVVVIDHNDELLERATEGAHRRHASSRTARPRDSRGRATPVSRRRPATSIAFLDDDACAEPGLARTSSCAPLKDDDVAGVGGWIVPEWQGRPATWFPRDLLLDPRVQLRGAAPRPARRCATRSAPTWCSDARLRRGRRLHLRHRPHRQGAARLRGDRAVHPLHRRRTPTSGSCSTHDAVVHHARARRRG